MRYQRAAAAITACIFLIGAALIPTPAATAEPTSTPSPLPAQPLDPEAVAAPDPTPTPGPAAAQIDTHSLMPYLPVATQVQQTGGWGITVGDTFYPSSAASSSVQGYQALILSRIWAPSADVNSYSPGGAANPDPFVPVTQVANLFFEVSGTGDAAQQDIQQMQTALLSSGSYGDTCDGIGCYLIISSQGGMGWTSCPGQDSTVSNCGTQAQPGGLFTQLGGTPSASYAPATAAYSLVTTVSASAGTSPIFSPAGQGTESLGCTLSAGTSSGQSTCADRAADGAVAGAFVNYLPVADADTGQSGALFAFTTTDSVSITARSVNEKTGVNTVTVGTPQNKTTYTSDPDVASLSAPGFQLVALDRTSLELLANETSSASAADSSADLEVMVDNYLDSSTWSGENVIWVIASIGDVENNDPGMYALSQAIASIGGSFSVFNQLGEQPPGYSSCTSDDEYALIGWRQPDLETTGLAPGAGLENSGGVLCQTAGPTTGPAQSVTQQALFKPDNRSFYSPKSSSGVAGSSGLQAAVLQPAGPSWPPTAAVPAGKNGCTVASPGAPAGTAPTAGQAAAYTYLSAVIQAGDQSGFADLDSYRNDIRSYYTDFVNDSEDSSTGGDAGNWLTYLNAASYPANTFFTCQDFAGVKAQLTAELTDLGAVATYFNTMYQALDTAQGTTPLAFQNMYDLVNATIQPSDDTTLTANVLSYFGTALGDLLPIAVPGAGDVIGPGLDAITQSLAFGLDITSNADNGTPAATLTTTWGELDSNLSKILGGAQNGLLTAMQLAVTDYTRLTQTTTNIKAFNSVDFPSYNGAPPSSAIAGLISNGLSTAALQSLVGSVYSSVTLPALFGDPEPSVTDVAYPSVALSPGGSIHRAICQDEGSCLAERQGNGFDQAQAYPMTLANQPQPTQGPGYFYWQTSFMYLTSTCDPPRCDLYFPPKDILALLFDPVGQPVTVKSGANTYTAPSLGLWPAYVLGPGGVIPPVPPTSFKAVVCAATTYDPSEECSPDNVGNPPPSASPRPSPPVTSRPSSTPSARPMTEATASPAVASSLPANTPSGGSPDLADTGAPFNSVWPLGVGVLMVVAGLICVAVARRRHLGR